MNISNRTIVALMGAVAVSALAACSPGSNTKHSQTPQNTQEIFSDRTAGLTTELIMVQLDLPPLLETSGSAEELQAVLHEQEQFEQKLFQISSEIRVVYRYKYTLNGFALATPAHLIPEILQAVNGKTVERAHNFDRPKSEGTTRSTVTLKGDAVTSVTYMGANYFHEKGLRGQGLSVGVIDTGVDYTHAMLGGSGRPEDYKTIDPNKATPLFPNEKVVGGIDLVGTRFGGSQGFYDQVVPAPDSNPIDEAGHGTHVAGTIAGNGDGVHTYDGVAPDAKVYAIKVFGNNGGTLDAVVIAGFEYAMDPNGDMNTNDRLDVINMSLGGGFGIRKILYSRAIKNLVKSGMVVVASAGNSGDLAGVVGAPSTSDQAISVAASVDGRSLNWQFPTVRFEAQGMEDVVTDFKEASFSKPLKEVDGFTGKLVDIGMGDQALSDEIKAKLKGNVALIQRGKISFTDKFKRALEGGAVGVVVYNNVAGETIPMGQGPNDTFKAEIPGVMISKAVGDALVQTLKNGKDVVVDMKNSDVIQKPELVDTITDFSSRGPRSDDYGFKPEVAAPGLRILSAGMGTGVEGILENGTSMAAPHVAGAALLIKQLHPEFSAKDVRDLLTSTAYKLKDASGNAYKFTTQGTGRVDMEKILKAEFVTNGSISMGLIEVPQTQTVKKSFSVKNLSNHILVLQTSFTGEEMSVEMPATITLQPKEERQVEFSLHVEVGSVQKFPRRSELDGIIQIRSEKEVQEVSIMAFRMPRSELRVTKTSSETREIPQKEGDTGPKVTQERVSMTVSNVSPVTGGGFLFNLIGEDEKKVVPQGEEWKANDCDLKSVGYRWILKPIAISQRPYLQFAFQLHENRSQLIRCELSVLVDGDKDGKIDQEIIGLGFLNDAGGKGEHAFIAGILDYQKAQRARLAYEVELLQGNKDAQYRVLEAGVAQGSIRFASESGMVIVEIPVDPLKVSADGSFNAKIASLNSLGESVEADDYLGSDETQWRTLQTDPMKMAYWGMSDASIAGGTSMTLTSMKNSNENPLVMYSPSNSKSVEMTIIQP